jgi:Galactose oxidase, central domain
MLFRESGSNCLPNQTKAVFFVAVTLLFAQSALAQSWNLLAPTGPKPAARGMNGTPGVYDSTSNRMILFGGRDGSGQNLNDVWVLENANGLGGAPNWLELIPNGAAGSPPARSGHSTVYDPVNNRLIVFGGCGGDCLPVLNDVWVLTNANGLGGTAVWTELQVTGGPAARTNAAVAYDSTKNELFVISGQDGTADPCSSLSDLWVLFNANGSGGGTPFWLPAYGSFYRRR